MRHATLPHPFHACTNGHGPTCSEFDCCHPCPVDSALEAHLAYMEVDDEDLRQLADIPRPEPEPKPEPAAAVLPDTDDTDILPEDPDDWDLLDADPA